MRLTRPAAALGALALTAALALAGCSDDGDDADTPDASSSQGSDDADGSEAADPAEGLLAGCEMVSADDVQAALDIEAGKGKKVRSAVGGPESCEYSAIAGIVQISPEADVYFAGQAYDAGELPGAEDAPAPADRGYVAVGGFLVVKGDNGVLFTSAAPGDTTLEQWTALAEATAAKLP